LHYFSQWWALVTLRLRATFRHLIPSLVLNMNAAIRDILSALDRDGYVVIVDALDEKWVTRLRRAFEALPIQASGTQHVQIVDETPEVESWRALECHAALVAAAEHVLGGSRWALDIHGRNPLPGFGQQGLHTDGVPRAPGAPYSVFTTLWMLDDFTVENGATRVVPGSHLQPRPISKALAQPLARHPDEIIPVGRAGSALMLNGHLLHSGRRNDSKGPRRAVQMVVRASAPR
jgi:ectoine hydroxylase-related dioxygenase (phytanoyl-CoA dioxygenase family)